MTQGPLRNLQSELCLAAGEGNVPMALSRLQLVTSSLAGEIGCVVIRDWHRSGAESYSLRFDVVHHARVLTRLVMKAVIPSSPVTPPDDYLAELLRRRDLLVANGVAVPRLYYSGRGLVIEDFIPFQLNRWLASSPACHRTDILGQVSRYALRLDTLGFSPIDPFADLRTDGELVYAIDFGEDLGPPYQRIPSEAVLHSFHRWESTLAHAS